MIRGKKRKKKWRRIAAWLILPVLILGYILFFSPLFKVRAIEVGETSKRGEISLEELKNAFKYDNIFLYTKNDIKEDLMTEFSIISDIGISKNIIKRSIKLNIIERERLGIICQMEKCFYIDKTGIIFEDAPQTSGSLILLIKDYSQRNFDIGNSVLEERIVDFIYKLKENLFLQTGVKALEFNLLSFPPIELKVVTSEGWYAIFSLDRDTESQLLVLKTVLEEKIKNREGLEYIDLRIENRAYYK